MYRIFCGPLYLLSAAVRAPCALRIAKPLLLVTTPLGLLEAFIMLQVGRRAVVLMVAMVGVLVAALGTILATIQREEQESKRGL